MHDAGLSDRKLLKWSINVSTFSPHRVSRAPTLASARRGYTTGGSDIFFILYFLFLILLAPMFFFSVIGAIQMRYDDDDDLLTTLVPNSFTVTLTSRSLVFAP